MAGMQKYGGWAFLIGIVIALLAGIWSATTGSADATVTLVLVVLGLLVGLLNIQDKETMPFLVAAIALGAGSATLGPLSATPLVGEWLLPIFNHIAVFIAPAAFIVALKAIYGMAREA